MFDTIKVNYRSTNDIEEASEFLAYIKSFNLIAADFEVAKNYDEETIEACKVVVESFEYSKLDRIKAQAILKATALDHPSHCTLTHCSIAVSESEGFVFILDTYELEQLILDFLVSTIQTQVWHNASYDFKHIFYRTGKFPKRYEDTQILAKTLLNHTNPIQAKTGLKLLAGAWYGDWAVSADEFTLEQMYEESMLRYAATDACATLKLWEYTNEQCDAIDAEILEENPNVIPMVWHPTDDVYSPWDQLPAPIPMEASYLTRHFYENTAKHLIRDTVRVMMNGLNIDLQRVIELEETLNQQIDDVSYKLANNELIQEFNQLRHQSLVTEYLEDRKSKLKSPEEFFKPFSSKDMLHRSYFMTLFANQQGIPLPTEELYPNIAKWPVKLVKKLATTRPILQRLLDGTLSNEHPLVQQAEQAIAELKASLRNKSYEDQIANPSVPVPDFNPGSSLQKQQLFEFLGIEPIAFSKDTGQPSWGRDQIEEVHNTTSNELIKQLTKTLIDHSYAAIVRNNFIEAFYNFTVDGRLYGNYSLLGAKSGRFTSNKPNMLNTPSTGSIFSKPIKRCFTAKEGFVVGSIDYSALEDRVVANLSKDSNKLGLFLEGLDGHSLSATYYYPEKVADLVGPYTDNKQASRKLKSLVDKEDPKAESVRQDSKPISLTYKRLHTVMYVE